MYVSGEGGPVDITSKINSDKKALESDLKLFSPTYQIAKP